jgi:hypothetical protein
MLPALLEALPRWVITGAVSFAAAGVVWWLAWRRHVQMRRLEFLRLHVVLLYSELDALRRYAGVPHLDPEAVRRRDEALWKWMVEGER